MQKTEDIGGLRWKTVDAVKLEGQKELAQEIMRIVNLCHFGHSKTEPSITAVQRYNALRNGMINLCEEIIAE